MFLVSFFFFQAEDGIRDKLVTGVQTCALPIYVFVVPLDEARTGDWSKLRSLLVAAEVLSPSTARADRFTKRRRYQEAGVPLYWIVDGEEQRVEVWTPDAELPTIETQRLVWRPAGARQPFTLELAELFRPV